MSRKWTMWRTNSTARKTSRARRNPSMAHAKTAVANGPGADAADAAAVDALASEIKVAGLAIRNSRRRSPMTRHRKPQTSKATRIKTNKAKARRCKLVLLATHRAKATAGKTVKMATASAAAADGAADAATAVTAKAMATPRKCQVKMAAKATNATAPTICHRQIHHRVMKRAHLSR